MIPSPSQGEGRGEGRTAGRPATHPSPSPSPQGVRRWLGPAGARLRRVAVLVLAAALLGGGFLAAGAIIIRIKDKSGQIIELRPAEGSSIEIETDGVALTIAPSTPPKPGQTWQPTGSLRQARHFHSATLLRDGKVLVTGGNLGDEGATRACELYDPTTGTWSATGSLRGPGRVYGPTVLLDDGKVLQVGGGVAAIGPRYDVCELYDPRVGAWSITDSLAENRMDHTVTLLSDGRILVTGGSVQRSNAGTTSCELYDPAAATWSPATEMRHGRLAHTAVRLAGGKVLVAGGLPNIYAPAVLTSCELYDPNTNTWTPTGGLATRRYNHGATMLNDGRVLVAGGALGAAMPRAGLSSCEVYDPAKGTWAASGGLTAGVGYMIALTRLPDGRVLGVGGLDLDASSTIGNAELYEAFTNSWTVLDPVSSARFAHTATLLNDGTVLVAGGGLRPDGVPIASCELYRPRRGTGAEEQRGRGEDSVGSVQGQTR